jgi:hypothetical protein
VVVVAVVVILVDDGPASVALDDRAPRDELAQAAPAMTRSATAIRVGCVPLVVRARRTATSVRRS